MFFSLSSQIYQFVIIFFLSQSLFWEKWMRKQLFPRLGTFMQTLPIIITENRNHYFLAVSKTPPQVHFRYQSSRSLTSHGRHPHPPAPPLVSSHSSIGIYACQWIHCPITVRPGYSHPNQLHLYHLYQQQWTLTRYSYIVGEWKTHTTSNQLQKRRSWSRSKRGYRNTRGSIENQYW